jgi:menaquinone-9 beta-reductase
MNSTTYDIVTVGGGLGGAALAKAMAEHGARVLVLEAESQFRDRVRGESMMSWGVAEAIELGIYDAMMASGGHELPWFDLYGGPGRAEHRDLTTTTKPRVTSISFYHPAMQEALTQAAADSGAEVQREARVRGLTTNGMPTVIAEVNRRQMEIPARLVVGADGRGSRVRAWAGINTHRDPDRNFIAGVLLDDVPAPEDACHLWPNPNLGMASVVFPQGNGRVRAYLVYSAKTQHQLSGELDIPQFTEESLKAGAPTDYFANTKAAGPLATFEGAATWAEYPYKSGVVLIGDAAAASDPSWGQGLSLTLRDVRVLRDQLLNHESWEEAGGAYAEEHRQYYGVLHEYELWRTQLLLETGPAAEARRGRALPLWQEDPTRQLDILFSGPYHPLDEAARRRFFGEE